MNEAEWLACESPSRLFAQLKGRASDRKLRLFICACCRRARHLLPDETSRAAIELGEQLADGESVENELVIARKQFFDADIEWTDRAAEADFDYDRERTAASASAYAAVEAIRSAVHGASDAIEKVLAAGFYSSSSGLS